ncbi:orotate phosphoribosyltransferase [Candidatus Nitrosocosmicus franklandus]|uniref:Orotate phosphoribosyltransferase n=1 Tax=Candidatus Nitrosocosmicus franklandianus TaxID=1798806 RepID=A0A484II53_9ARCH|nr:phosphoribosyltransferase family protein [Candidatus Nitrosocosmicus franklandus]VFJ15345.1 Orotate phosphoribosyltransferase [Candidatus Nitrosocosmicus franklandus]
MSNLRDLDYQEQLREEIVTFLYDVGAIRLGNFTLSSGNHSSFYIDLRMLQSYPLYFRKTISLLKTVILLGVGIDNFDYICSIPTSGTIFGSSLAYELFKPHIYVRKDPKTYGTQKKIEGNLVPGSRVLFIEDVVTTGNSLLSAVKSIADCTTHNRVVAIIDRKQGATEKFQEYNVFVDSVISIVRAIEILRNNNRISHEDYNTIKREMTKI